MKKLTGFKLYAREERSIIGYVKMLQNQKAKRNYCTMPNRAASIIAVNCIPTKFN